MNDHISETPTILLAIILREHFPNCEIDLTSHCRISSGFLLEIRFSSDFVSAIEGKVFVSAQYRNGNVRAGIYGET